MTEFLHSSLHWEHVNLCRCYGLSIKCSVLAGLYNPHSGWWSSCGRHWNPGAGSKSGRSGCRDKEWYNPAYFRLSDLLLWACSQVNSARPSPPCLHGKQDKSSLSYAIWVSCLFTEMRQEANVWTKHPKLLLTLVQEHALRSSSFFSCSDTFFTLVTSLLWPLSWAQSSWLLIHQHQHILLITVLVLHFNILGP